MLTHLRSSDPAWLMQINQPRTVQNRNVNCISCTLAVDSTLGGRPMRARATPVAEVDAVLREVGLSTRSLYARAEGQGIEVRARALASSFPAWTRGLAHCGREERAGHVFNFVRLPDKLLFLDGQTGTFAEFRHDFVTVEIYRTGTVDPSMRNAVLAFQPINLREANMATLRTLPGVSGARAKALTKHRRAHGLESLEEALQVLRVHEVYVEAFSDWATLGPPRSN